jgi:LacI family transcriptional regulator
MQRNGSTSLRQIAEASGVSISTASRALLRQSNVRAETRKRVLAAADRFKYRPNLLVRGMQTGRTHTVGVMLRVTDPFYGQIYAGIHDALLAVDHVPILVWSGRDPQQARRGGVTELDQIHRLVDRRVDGVILVPVVDAASDDYLHEVWDRKIPLVAIDRELPESQANFVGCDDRAIGQMAAEHLLGLGHRRLGHLAGPGFASTGRHRREGFEAAAAAAGAQVVVVEEPTFMAGHDKADELLNRPDRPTAIFAANDHLALSVYDAAAQLGLRVPEDLSVMGCGNLAYGKSLRPSLTTIDQQPRKIGQQAAQLLLRARDGGDDPTDPVRIRLSPELVPRASTAAFDAPSLHP